MEAIAWSSQHCRPCTVWATCLDRICDASLAQETCLEFLDIAAMASHKLILKARVEKAKSPGGAESCGDRHHDGTQCAERV
jgi:hypothetical protein